MDERTSMTRLRIGLAGLALATGFALVLPQSAKAQDAGIEQPPPPPETAPEMAEDGTFTYSRDVRHSIGQPFFPKQTDWVVTGPARMITATVGAALVPITDDEASYVTASMAPPGTSVENTMATGMLALDEQRSGNMVTVGQAGSVVGKTVDTAMDALSGALGSLSILSGGGPE